MWQVFLCVKVGCTGNITTSGKVLCAQLSCTSEIKTGTISCNLSTVNDLACNNKKIINTLTTSFSGSLQNYLHIVAGNLANGYGCVLGGGVTQTVGDFATLSVQNNATDTEVLRVCLNSAQFKVRLSYTQTATGIGSSVSIGYVSTLVTKPSVAMLESALMQFQQLTLPAIGVYDNI